MKVVYPFDQDELRRAAETWGCNCGPSALAFACQVKLEVVRPHIPDFEAKGYTSPAMMRAALADLGRRFIQERCVRHSDGRHGPRWQDMFICESMALTRIQWTGPWTAPGVNLKWAYGHTHWIATWGAAGGGPFVFDCNGGAMTYDDWQRVTVPDITREIKRADGGWFPTHIWRLL